MNQRSKKARRHPRSAMEILLEQKAKKLLAAERQYWTTTNSLHQRRNELAAPLDLPLVEAIPSEVSSTVWALKDGVAFVRYKSVSTKPQVDFRVLPLTLEEWARTGMIVPLSGGEVSLARFGMIGGLGTTTLVNCRFNDLHVPYVSFSHLKYGDTTNAPSVETAILDFQLALMGLHASSPQQVHASSQSTDTVASLTRLADEFEALLGEETREEEIQRFLKTNPFILHPSAEAIPKQKLGDDFVTDFVLVATSAQGPTYILVELERASHPLLTKDYSLSHPVSHALKQTRDWDVWLERNRAYLQNKLPGFETPTPSLPIWVRQ